MRVLTLGAGGFIGAHLTERLLAEGHVVIAVDIYKDKIREFLDHERLIFVEQDIRKHDWKMNGYVQDSDIVIDLIAYANPGLYLKFPLEVFKLNFLENLKIAESCVQHNKRIIQFSTCEVYGRTVVTAAKGQIVNPEDSCHARFSEDTSEYILGPVVKHRWIYACAKQLLERVLHAYGLENGLNYTIIRPFNFIGPKIDYLLDDTDGMPRVFSFFMDALMNGTQMKLVDGGKQRRCYTYIEDAIECIYRIIENPGGVCNQEIFNVGSSMNEVSIREMAIIMRDIYAKKYLDPNIPLPEIVEISGEQFYGKGYEDSDRRIPDTSKIETLLGFEPKWEFRKLIESTMEYYNTEYMSFYRPLREIGSRSHDIVKKVISGGNS